MGESNVAIERTEEELLTSTISDEALEQAANLVTDKGGSLTISFCTGLDTCPG